MPYAITGLKNAFLKIGPTLRRAGGTCGKFLREIFVTHYHALGQYTFPFNDNPPPLNKRALTTHLIFVFLLPIAPIAWLLSLTIVPLIGNSIQSLAKSFVTVLNNLGFFGTKTPLTHPEIGDTNTADDKRNIARQLYSLPGYLIGSALAFVVSLPVLFVRTLIQSWESLKRTVISTAELAATKKEIPSNSLRNDSRTKLNKALGFPGNLFAALVVSPLVMLGRVLWNSLRTTGRFIVSMGNAALADEDQLLKSGVNENLENDTTRKVRRFGFGILGIIPGVIIGSVGFVIIGTLRILKKIAEQSAESFMRLATSVRNLYATKEDYIATDLKNDSRSKLQKALGIPGLIISAVIAAPLILLARALWNNARTFARVVTSAANLALHKDDLKYASNFTLDEKIDDVAENKNRLARRFGFGNIGLALGVPVGIIAFITVGIGRVISNTAKSFKRFFVYMLKASTRFATAKPITLEQDPRGRSKALGPIVGILGAPLGTIVAAPLAILVTVGRALWNSARTLARLVTTMARAALHNDDLKYASNFTINDNLDNAIDKKHRLARRFGLGVLGLIPGAVIGAIAFAIVGFGRIISNSATSFKRFFMLMLHAGTRSATARKIELELDERKGVKFQKVGPALGTPGVLLGVILGAPFTALTTLGRVLWNSARTMSRLIVSMTRAALHKDDLQHVSDFTLSENLDDASEKKNRLVRRFGLGVLGLIPGAVIGAIAFAAISVGRVITNTAKSFKRFFVYMLQASARFATEKPFDLEEDQQARFKKLGPAVGIVGVVLGTIFAAPLAAFVAVGRALWNTARTFARLVTTMANAALHKDDLAHASTFTINEKLDDAEEKINRLARRFGLGALGLIPGAIIGAIAFVTVGLGRIFSNSAKSFRRFFMLMVHAGTRFATTHEIKLEEDQRADVRFKKFGPVTGTLGVLTGVVLGSIATTLITLGRIAWNSLRTFARTTASVANLALHEDDLKYASQATLFNLDKDSLVDNMNSVVRRVGVGFLGLIPGAIVGALGFAFISIGRVITNSATSFKRFFMLMVHAASRFATAKKVELELDERKDVKFQKFGPALGTPGVFLGVILGAPLTALTTLGRVLWNSARTFARLVNTMARAALHKDDLQYTSDFTLTQNLNDAEKKNHLVRRFGLGALGLIPGAIIGALAVAAISVGRVITNTAKSFKRFFVYMLQASARFATDKTIELEQDEQARFKKLGSALGLPGVVLGTAFAAPLAVLVAVGRTLWNTARTMGRLVTTMANAAIHKDDLQHASDFTINEKLDIAAEKKNRLARRFGLGLLGLIPGAIIGAIAFVTVGAGRIISNTAKSFKRFFVYMLQASARFATNKSIDLERDARGRSKVLGPALGYAGSVLGTVAAAPLSALFTVGRVLWNSARTFGRFVVSFANLALDKEDQLSQHGITENLATDTNRKVRRFGLGVLGIVPGAIVGALSFLIVAAGRAFKQIIENSLETLTQTFRLLVNLPLRDLPTEKQLAGETLLTDTRHPAKTFLLGLPGYLLGAVAGLIALVGVSLARIAISTFQNTVGVTLTLANQTLPKENEVKLPVDDRPYLVRFAGVIGYGLGAIFGSIAAAAIFVGRVISNSVKTWRALSGSMMNLALSREDVFDGLKTNPSEKTLQQLGAPGYALAAITTLPVAAITWAARMAVNVVGPLLLGVIVAPFVFFGKLISKKAKAAQGNTRFKPEDDQQYDVTIMQKFKNIYSSLTAFGQVATDYAIKANGTGEKSKTSFARKVFTFNLKSITEEVLDTLLKKYREFTAKDDGVGVVKEEENFFQSASFTQTIASLMQPYKKARAPKKFNFYSRIERREARSEIEGVANLVKDYMLKDKADVPQDLYTRADVSWKTIFWGKRPAAPAAVVSDDEIIDLPQPDATDVPPATQFNLLAQLSRPRAKSMDDIRAPQAPVIPPQRKMSM